MTDGSNESENCTEPEREAAAEDEQETISAAPLQERISELELELAQSEDRYLRAAAELRNYRKRVAQQSTEQLQYAQEQLVSALLPVLDHMQLALQSSRSEEQSANELLSGVEMIHQQLLDVLQGFGLRRLNVIDEQFDPKLHEAVERRTAPDEELENGQIIAEFRPGYKLHDRLLRPAEVCVSISEETGEGNQQ